jgi:hypothetical protein
MVESQLKPEYGDACNPYDLFEGRLFAVHVRKVGDWNNYDMCQFIGEKGPIEVSGRKMEKTQTDMEQIVEYLKTGPQNLVSFDYKDWDDEMTDKVMTVIRNTVPDGRLINEVTGGANKASAPSRQAPPPSPTQSAPPVAQTPSSDVDDFFKSTSAPTSSPAPKKAETSSSSLDDLYADL